MRKPIRYVLTALTLALSASGALAATGDGSGGHVGPPKYTGGFVTLSL